MMLFISGIINLFLKDYFQDPRPPMEFMLDPKIGTSYGLPSGHAQIAVTLWGLLAYELKNKWITVLASILIMLICFSRLYLGVHDIEDVLFGLIIGLLILTIWHSVITSKFFKELSRTKIILLILVFQFMAYIFYPTHQGHEISIWFLGAMAGWYLGSSNINFINNNMINFLLSLISTGAVFFAMIFSTNLADIYTSSSLIGFLTNYSLGFIFSFFVTYIIPSVWVFFSLASDTHD
jgi:hypothetical protein